MKTTQPLASRKEVAERLGLPPSTLADWAHRGIGPRYRRLGKAARYDWLDVETWIESQEVYGGQSAA
jgi:predicted DNA-binding transcriptional regulator AlpA